MKKYISIKDAGLYDPKAGLRDANVIIKNSKLEKLRKDLKEWKLAAEAWKEAYNKLILAIYKNTSKKSTKKTSDVVTILKRRYNTK